MFYSQFLLALVGLLSSTQLASSYTFGVNCTLYPGPCNNNCYAIFVANKPSKLNWDTPTEAERNRRRREAGCTPNPCQNGNMDKANTDETSCDEYPYAATVEGGSGAILRCTDSGENSLEGSALAGFLTRNDGGCGGEQCTFDVVYTDATANQPYCYDEGGANDGYEYEKNNGNYIQAKRDADGNIFHERHVPDPAELFPLEKRREFLLDNGKVGLLISRDLETDYTGKAIPIGHENGETSVAKVVRELHGMDKSPALRPRHLKSRIVGA